MPTVIPRQYSEDTMPMWLESLINNIMVNPVSTAVPVAEGVAQGALPFSKAALAALKRWKNGPPLAEMPPSGAVAPMAQEAAGPVQGMLDFGEEAVASGAGKLKQMMGQLDLPFGDNVPVRGVPDKLGPGFPVPKQSPVGKSPFPAMNPKQQKLPMEIPTTKMGAPLTSPVKVTPPLTPGSPVGAATAGRLGKAGQWMKKNPGKTALGAGLGGAVAWDASDGSLFDGAPESPVEAPTGGGRGRVGGVAKGPSGPDWSQLEAILQAPQEGASPAAAPSSPLQTALAPQGQKKEGFDWSQLTQMLPALLVALTMMKRR